MIRDHEVGELVLEEPAAMGMVGRSTMSVGKLMFLEGMVSYIGLMLNQYRYKVNTWKGSLPKHAVTQRVNRVLDLSLNAKPGYDGMDTDIADAIGVGLYHLRREYGEFHKDHYFGGGSRS